MKLNLKLLRSAPTKNFIADKKNILPFINPSRIILGWNYKKDEKQKELYQDLIAFAHSKGIEIGYLEKYVDYEKNQFIYQKL